MKLFLSVVLLISCFGAQAQKEAQVMDWKTDLTLNTWLMQRVREQSERRTAEFNNALASKTSAARYAASVRSRLRKLAGQMPARQPVSATITGSFERKGYRVENILYRSSPQYLVTANLYLPAGKGPFPAVLFFCGHEDAGKATESYQRTAILLAQNGFVVFCIDPVSQAERYQITDSDGTPLTRGGTTEHTLLNTECALAGTSVAASELWDNFRGLDYLLTRPEVDASRIGCLGNSGGAMQAMYFTAFDKRVRAMAVCSYLSTRLRSFETSGPADGCAQIPGEGAAGIDMADLLIANAPNPVLVLAGRYDFIDYQGTREAVGELRKFYSTLGVPDRLRFFTYDDGHGISKPKREEAVRWFRSCFYKDDRPVSEPEIQVEQPELLFAAAGSVVRSYPSAENLVSRARRLADSAASYRAGFTNGGRAGAAIRLSHFLNSPPTKLTGEEARGEVLLNGLSWRRSILRGEGEPPLPVLSCGDGRTAGRIVIVVNGTGKSPAADSISRLPDSARAGTVYILADLRGTGETEDRPSLNDPKYYNREYRNAAIALHIGDPLPVQRLRDLRLLVEWVRILSMHSGIPIEVYASGLSVVPALHLLTLDPYIGRLTIPESPRSWREWLEHPADKDLYSIVIPGVLRLYDIPDLIRAIGPDRIRILSK